MDKSKFKWDEEIVFIKELLDDGYRVHDIASLYDVSRVLIYKKLEKYDIETNKNVQYNFLKGRSVQFKWLNRKLSDKGFSKKDRIFLLDHLDTPEFCPVLGMKLNYENIGYKKDNSPSIDRIDSKKGYAIENIHIISDRANRIKNDSTVEELIKITKYFISIAK